MYAVVVCLWKLNESELFFVCARGRYRALLNCAHVYIIAIAIEYLPFIAKTWKNVAPWPQWSFCHNLKIQIYKRKKVFLCKYIQLRGRYRAQSIDLSIITVQRNP